MSTQLSTEGAHHEAVAKPPALCADGNPDAQERDAEGEFMRAVHERTALQGMQAESTPRVVDVKVHRAGVRMTGSTFNTGLMSTNGVPRRVTVNLMRNSLTVPKHGLSTGYLQIIYIPSSLS
jgi:hypothetical protein